MLNFDFSKEAAQNTSINKVYNRDFLFNPQTTSDKRRQSDYANHPQIFNLIKKMETLHKKHDSVKSRLESALQKRVTRSVDSDNITSTRMDEEIALQFSGRTKVIVNVDRPNDGMNNFNFINSGRSFSGGAHIDQSTGDMQVSLYLPNNFMNFGSKSQISSLYSAFEIAKGHLKGAISHELTHTTQISDFSVRRKNFQSQTRSGNSVAQYVDGNAASYTPIDSNKNPLISKLYNHLGNTLKSTFSAGSSYFDMITLKEGKHGNQAAQADFTYFDYIIRHFSPDEIDAYVRGHRTDAVASIKRQQRQPQETKREQLYRNFENTIRSRVDGLFPANNFHLHQRIKNHMQTLGINYRNLRVEAIDSYLSRYDELFGLTFEVLPELEQQSKQINPSRTQGEKLADAIDAEASLEFRTDPKFVNSILYMKNELRKPTVNSMMLDQIKQMIRDAGYEIRTGSGKMGNRIFKRT